MSPPPKNPNWDQLFDLATGQDGFFTTKQASDVGYSSQLLNHYVQTERLVRRRRGIYRIVHFPPGTNDDFMIAWLWTEREGVLSHETALFLHGLSDLLPSLIHVSVPSAQQARRRQVPPEFVLHFSDVPITDRTWIANVPTTTPRRTLIDCAITEVAPEFLRQAADQALRRGVISRSDLVQVDQALQPFERPTS